MGLFKKRAADSSGGNTGSPNTVYAAGTGGAAVIPAGATRARTIATESRSAAVGIALKGTPNAGAVYVGVSTYDRNAGIELSPGIRLGKHTYELRTFTPDGSQRSSIAMDAEPSRILVAPAGVPNAGTVYVLDWQNDKVAMIRPGGSTSSTLNTGAVLVGAVAGAGLPNAGNVYIVEQGQSKLITIRPDGTVSVARDVTNRPTALAIAPADTPSPGTIYVAGSTNVTIIRPDGSPARTIDTVPSPHSIAIAPAGTPNAGTVYVASWNSNGLAILTPDGDVVNTIDACGHVNAEGILVAPPGTPDAGAVFACDYIEGTLTRIDHDGTVTGKINVGKYPTSIAIAAAESPAAGTLYVGTDESVAVVSSGGASLLCRVAVPYGMPQLVVVP